MFLVLVVLNARENERSRHYRPVLRIYIYRTCVAVFARVRTRTYMAFREGESERSPSIGESKSRRCILRPMHHRIQLFAVLVDAYRADRPYRSYRIDRTRLAGAAESNVYIAK